MALGTFTNTQKLAKADSVGYLDRAQIVGDNSYPTGGTTGFSASVQTATKQGGREVVGIIDNTGDATYYVVYVKATDALKVFVRATGLEVANATDTSGKTWDLLVISI